MVGLKAADIAVLIAYFVIVAGIGFLATRLIRNREDFFMGGRRFGKILTIFFSFGAGTHADDAVTVSSKSYKVGLAGIWYQWVMLFTLPIYWLLAPIFRRARVFSTADFFDRRYGTSFGLLYAAFGLFICVGYTGVMLFGSARVIEGVTGGAISLPTGILLVAGVSVLYGILGGLVAAAWNDLFQGVLTIVMSLLIPVFFWSKIGGAEGFRAALPDPAQAFRLVLGHEMTVYWIVMMSIGSLFSMVVQPHIMANTGAAKSEMDSRVGFVGGMILKRLITVPWALTGVMAIALFGAGTINSDHAFGLMARQLLPAGCAGLMIACVMASVMDNCAVLMVSFSSIYTNSIHKRVFPRAVEEASLVRVARIASALFILLSVGLGFVFEDVPAARRFLWKTVPLMGIPFFLGLWWRGANRWGAFASFFAALAALAAAEFHFQWKGDEGLPKTITLFLSTGIGAGILVSLLTRRESRRSLDGFYLLLKTPIGREEELRQAGLVEVPGTGTFEAPPAAPAAADEKDSRHWEFAKPARSTVVGFLVVTAIMLAMLGGVKLLADGLAGR